VKVVIDTNVFVSSFFGGKPKAVIDLWKTEQITLCLSKDILDEYVEVFRRLELDEGPELQEILAFFSRGFNLLFIRKTPAISVVQADPDDDKFITCGVALGAEFIVTGDKALKAIKNYKGSRILDPGQFLAMKK
jgi:putative PIN family toxin of toxin-antitoxin system